MANVTAIILAAGTSSRMGEANKLLLDFKGQPIVKWVIDSVQESSIEELVVVGSELSLDHLKHLVPSDSLLVENQEYKSGMTSSIKAGVRVANKSNAIMICLGDLPLLKTDSINLILEAYHDNSDRIVLPSHNGRRGNPVIFPPDFRSAILEHQEPEGCKGIVQMNKDRVLLVEVDSSVLKDIDTSDQYEDLLRD